MDTRLKLTMPRKAVAKYASPGYSRYHAFWWTGTKQEPAKSPPVGKVKDLQTSTATPLAGPDGSLLVSAVYIDPGMVSVGFRDGFSRVVLLTKLVQAGNVLSRLRPESARPSDDGSAVVFTKRHGSGTYDVDSLAIRAMLDPSARAEIAGEAKQSRTALGAHLRSVREQRGVSVAVAARAAGISEADLREIEAGRIHPKGRTLVALAPALGVTLQDLLPQSP